MAMSFLTLQISFLIRFTSFITDEKRTDSLKEGVSDTAAEVENKNLIGQGRCSVHFDESGPDILCISYHFFNRDLGTVDSFLIETSN